MAHPWFCDAKQARMPGMAEAKETVVPLDFSIALEADAPGLAA
jgi:hypothetical protein